MYDHNHVCMYLLTESSLEQSHAQRHAHTLTSLIEMVLVTMHDHQAAHMFIQTWLMLMYK